MKRGIAFCRHFATQILQMKNQLVLVLLALTWSQVKSQCNSTQYTPPDFTLSVQEPGCPQPGEIRVATASGGVRPYVYTLLPNNVTNTTGTFSNLLPGNYNVQLTDACGTIRTRQATITPYEFTASSSYAHLGCKDFQFRIGCSADGPALQYGYAVNGSTNIIWGDSSIIHLTLEPQSSVALYVRDSCGNTAVSQQTIPRDVMG